MFSKASPTPRHTVPISRHRAFPAILGTWLAAQCALAIWVIPAGGLRSGLAGTFAAPMAPLPQWMLAMLAALPGAALGLLAAHLIRQRHPAASKARAAASSTSARANILQVGDLQLPRGLDDTELLLGGSVAPALAHHHGAAVARLRDRAMADLSLIQLVERFAVALGDFRMIGATSQATVRLRQQADAGEHALWRALEKLHQMEDAA